MTYWLDALGTIKTNLLSLGTRRLLALGVTAVVIVTTVIVAAIQIGKAPMQVLYSGLSKPDSGKIVAALREANIRFDTSADGATVYVETGKTAAARMMLAGKGLPNSPIIGYELFDKVGSFGLTSFMQEVTRMRAIEGELARTIQVIEGVQMARVHVVAAERATFRQERREPTASVILQVRAPENSLPVAAIRHLVASAVQGLKPENVTIVSSDGNLLASPQDPQDGQATGIRQLEREIAREVRSNVEHALTPHIGARHFRTSVSVAVNMDRLKSEERIFLPDSRVERSVRVVRENTDAKDAAPDTAVSVKANIPEPAERTEVTAKKTEVTQKKEEITNYEISSRTINKTSGGYRISSLSVAVVLDRSSLPAQFTQANEAKELEQYLKDIEQLISVAAGLSPDRGDKIRVAAVDFVTGTTTPPPLTGGNYQTILANNLPNIVYTFGIVLIVLIITLTTVRPVLTALLSPASASSDLDSRELANRNAETIDQQRAPQIAGPVRSQPDGTDIVAQPSTETEQNDGNSTTQLRDLMVSDEQKAVAILRQWISEDKAA